MRKLLDILDNNVVTCKIPLLCKLETNKLKPTYQINKKWTVSAQLWDDNTTSTNYSQIVHVECLFYWIEAGIRKKALIEGSTVHERPIFWITTTPFNFVNSLPTFLQFFIALDVKKESYPYIFDNEVTNAINSVKVYCDALLSDSSRPESWVYLYNEKGYHELLIKRYSLEDVIFELAEFCLNNMIKVIDDWTGFQLSNNRLRSTERGKIESRSKSHKSMVSKKIDQIKQKKSENFEKFLDSIHSVVNIFINQTLEESIWRKINDLYLDITDSVEGNGEIKTLDSEIIEMIIDSLSDIENYSLIKDHIRADIEKIQEDNFRDYIKSYFHGRNGYRAESEYVNKLDGLSDVKLFKQNQRRTISLKVWNRNFSTNPPIEQLIGDMGSNEKTGFLIMVSNLKRDYIFDNHITKFIDNHALFITDTKKVIIDKNDISHISASYTYKENIFTIHHILLETKQFLKDTNY